MIFRARARTPDFDVPDLHNSPSSRERRSDKDNSLQCISFTSRRFLTALHHLSPRTPFSARSTFAMPSTYHYYLFFQLSWLCCFLALNAPVCRIYMSFLPPYLRRWRLLAAICITSDACLHRCFYEVFVPNVFMFDYHRRQMLNINTAIIQPQITIATRKGNFAASALESDANRQQHAFDSSYWRTQYVHSLCLVSRMWIQSISS